MEEPLASAAYGFGQISDSEEMDSGVYLIMRTR
jgi:hypothetical protein